MGTVWMAFGLTLFAGLATGIGSAIAFFAHRTNYRFLSVATGFSAGVMLYVSFVEIFAKGAASLSAAYGDRLGNWINAGSFFGGMAFIGVIDALIPAGKNPHETRRERETAPLHDPTAPPVGHEKKLMRMGVFTALAIAIHNFPEGLVTFLSVLENPRLGIVIAVAIALHNIPEGISVSVPIYYATGKRRKAFVYSLLSGLAEPIGALIAYGALRLFVGTQNGGVPPEIMGVLFGGVAGIMVYISLDELLPTSRAYAKGHESLLGLLGGMVVMALSLLLMR